MSVHGKFVADSPSIDVAGMVQGVSVDLFERALERLILIAMAVFAAPFVLFASGTLLVRWFGFRVCGRRSVRGDARTGLLLLVVGAGGFIADVAIAAQMQQWGFLNAKLTPWSIVSFATLRVGSWAFYAIVAVQALRLVGHAWVMWRHTGTIAAARARVGVTRLITFVASASVVMAALVIAYSCLQGLTPGWPLLIDAIVP